METFFNTGISTVDSMRGWSVQSPFTLSWNSAYTNVHEEYSRKFQNWRVSIFGLTGD